MSVVTAQRRTLTVDGFGTPEEWREYLKAAYGPTVAVYRSLGADLDLERVAALDWDLTALAARYDRGGESLVTDREYLLITERAHP